MTLEHDEVNEMHDELWSRKSYVEL
jgi:hypothetical protein